MLLLSPLTTCETGGEVEVVGGSASELFDAEVVRELREALDLEAREGLIGAFDASLRGYVAEIDDAIQCGDPGERRRARWPVSSTRSIANDA